MPEIAYHRTIKHASHTPQLSNDQISTGAKHALANDVTHKQVLID